MYKYILKRLLLMIPIILGVIIIVFTIMYIAPGDYATYIAGETATEDQIQEIREELGSDGTYIEQLVRYINNLLHGDFGTSYVTGRSVSEEIFARFPVTIQLAVCTIIVATVIGLLAGIISAITQYSIFDYVVQVIGLAGSSMPSFWLGLMLILLFSVKLGWLPPSGWNGINSWLLPSVAGGLGSCATIMRMTRSSMLDVIRQDYITTAQAKGQRQLVVIMRHALKNALIPIITIIGMQFGGMLGGTVLIETIFTIPGMGTLTVNAIMARNVPMVEGVVLLISLIFCLVNLFVDLLYSFVDPRIRSQYSSPKKKAAGNLAAAKLGGEK